MDSGSQIDNVQSFVEAIGDKYSAWKLLIGREVIRFEGGRGIVSRLDYDMLKIRVDCSIKIARYDDYYAYNPIWYTKDIFIKKFHKIDPPIFFEELIGLIKTAREVETRKQETEKRDSEKPILLKSLKEHFEQDFLNANDFYQAKCTKHISFKEYQAEKSNYVQSWVKRHLNCTTDPEQAAAIGAFESHVQVVARAGSGKTSTLVNRALFLQKHCGVAPDEMLLLAFNRKAAEEIRERLTSKLEGTTPHVMTFHAGYRWNTTGWKAWCRTCPAQDFSVQKFFGETMWISRADGIEVRFYDDLENEVGIYRVDNGQWSCVVDNIHILE